MLPKKPSGNKKLKNRVAAFHFAVILCLSLFCTCRAGTENLTNAHYSTTSISSSPSSTSTSEKFASSTASTSTSTSSSTSSSQTYQNAGTRTILRIYDECSRTDGGFVPCLKKKAISFIDRISHIDAITVADGIRVIRSPGNDYATAAAQQRPLVSENELETHLPRATDDRDTKLTNMLIERLSNFFNGHSLQVNFPKLTSEEIGRGLEEGRGKMKKMMSMMMMGMAMKMMGMIPVAMGMLYMLAGKALIISKIALLLSGIMGLKKLMSGRGGGGGGGSSGWPSSGGGGGGGWSSSGGGGGGSSGGWDRRSLNDAHNMAYRGYDKQYQQQPQKHQYDEKAPKS